MTNEKVIAALDLHDQQITAQFTGEPERANLESVWPGRAPALAHVRWMIQETKSFVQEGRTDKAMRWLGFIQGVLWVLGVSTIEESKRANMPEGEAYKP